MVGRFSISDQAYDVIKRQLLDGAHDPGERLDATVLAERHFWSITPVRAALHKLAGERFIEARSNEGFMTPVVTETSLRALYDLSWGLLAHALKIAAMNELKSDTARRLRTVEAAASRAPPDQNLAPPSDVAAATEQLFAAIGALSNVEYRQAIVTTSERLHTARKLEPGLIPDLEDELDSLLRLLARRDFAALERAINAYHKRRRRLVSDLVEIMQQGGVRRLTSGRGQ